MTLRGTQCLLICSVTVPSRVFSHLWQIEGYTFANTAGTTVFSAPLTNEPYSKVSGDFNPIHINPYFSDFASLPATITYGLWSSAATCRYAENVIAQGHPNCVLA
jgi:fatty acid synthase subunit alpha